ncbi:hypothetical protein LKL81_21855 [Bacillus paranthracis]|uniref:hypothetical protein n=1 Tax=Bacillus paranthracis TaxID=2026186 RepID=UPI001E422632|nr:hypothetical protein [Bacillus paranthracis]MCC2429863.1 hypothetical protein [Bacillus paranthracis]
MQSVQVYLGVPQQNTLPVYEGQQGQQLTITQMIFTNTDETDAKLTVTVNTIDIMKNYVVKTGETKIVDVSLVLNPKDRLFLQQEKINAINVMINGRIEPVTNY